MSATPARMAAAQLAPWYGFDATSPRSLAEMERLNEADAGCFILLLSGSEARFLQKPAHYPAEEIAGTREATHNLLSRALRYRRLFEDVLRKRPVDGAIRLALSVDDLVPEATIPLFTFQKKRGSRLVLLPDSDFLRHRFYAAPKFADTIPFEAKQDRALFVGSTSGGGTLTAENVRALRAPRLRAAMQFRGAPRVDFWLPRIVQTADQAASDAIAALGVSGRPLDWADHHAYRYLLSMDGNGATCSRVALALRGNGVLVKYESEHRLHYFDRLIPWTHYIPVGSDAEVERAMDLCAATPGLARSIAEAGTAFYRTHLERAALLEYTRDLLATYAAWCRRA
ncbi:glycosyl transferase family 90 [Roseomonas sp. AR75]|uniref:glycosyl transferase family 90 n=1 Tax=Roseomonas sp. AR75 TaxID=2562311 RepID=UPI0010C0F677|nr:glycosyl transferase family 90 [Roseomonas sp. AR75]